MEPEGALPHLQIQPPVPILSQIDPIHAQYPTSLRPILILSSHLSLGPPSGSFCQVSPPKPCVYTSQPLKRATYSTHLIPLDLFIHIILSEEYRSLGSPL